MRPLITTLFTLFSIFYFSGICAETASVTPSGTIVNDIKENAKKMKIMKLKFADGYEQIASPPFELEYIEKDYRCPCADYRFIFHDNNGEKTIRIIQTQKVAGEEVVTYKSEDGSKEYQLASINNYSKAQGENCFEVSSDVISPTGDGCSELKPICVMNAFCRKGSNSKGDTMRIPCVANSEGKCPSFDECVSAESDVTRWFTLDSKSYGITSKIKYISGE